MKTIIILYFFINGFLAGLFFERRYSWANDKRGRLKAIGYSLYVSLFGVANFIIAFMAVLLKELYVRIDKGLWIPFYFCWFFTKKYRRLSEDQLESINKIAAMHTKNTRQDRHWRYWAKKLNAANNYTYPPPDEEIS